MKTLFRSSLCLILAVILLGACAQKEPEQPPATPSDAAARQPAQPTSETPPAKQEAAPAPSGPAPAAQPAAPTPSAPQPAATPVPSATPAPQSIPAQPEKVAEHKLDPAEKPLPAKATAKDVVILKAALGGVRFEHKLHAEARKINCETCHHTSRAEKPNSAPQQACSACHSTTATAPMKTKLQAAFHNAAATAGTCIDCHKAEAAKGKPAPVKCLDCHKKENK